MESNHRKLVYETSVNTNSLRHKSPGDLYTASRRDTVRLHTQAPDGRPHQITRDGNRTRVTELKVRRTYPCATPAYMWRQRIRLFLSPPLSRFPA